MENERMKPFSPRGVWLLASSLALAACGNNAAELRHPLIAATP